MASGVTQHDGFTTEWTSYVPPQVWGDDWEGESRFFTCAYLRRTRPDGGKEYFLHPVPKQGVEALAAVFQKAAKVGGEKYEGTYTVLVPEILMPRPSNWSFIQSYWMRTWQPWWENKEVEYPPTYLPRQHLNYNTCVAIEAALGKEGVRLA